MKSFMTSLLAVAALAELAGSLSPPKAKAHVRRIAFLAALLVLLAPVRSLYERRGEFFEGTASLARSLSDGERDLSSADRRLTAGVIFRYAADRWKITPDRLKVIFTEEDGEIRAVRVEAKNCPYEVRAGMERELKAAFSPAPDAAGDAGGTEGAVEITVAGGG